MDIDLLREHTVYSNWSPDDEKIEQVAQPVADLLLECMIFEHCQIC